ncbi:MAG: DUF1795 domain-containing protein [Betaproteobacteria bacterium]|nr:DUF1795 domain-containing protein [Betaproteobacteria bacterium]
MPYNTNEGQFGFDVIEDGSINVLELLPHEDGMPLRLVMTRDRLRAGEDLNACLTRQVRELSRRMPEFKELSREAGWLGPGDDNSFPAIVLHTRFKQEGRLVFQAQCAAQLSEDKLLVLTLTSPRSFDGKLRARWAELLACFVPAPAFAPFGSEEA